VLDEAYSTHGEDAKAMYNFKWKLYSSRVRGWKMLKLILTLPDHECIIVPVI
jgi:hypothetical protein